MASPPPVPVAKTETVKPTLLANVVDGARRCWFAGQPRFRSLALIDERDSRDARLLVVDRSNPEGRPKLVIELNERGRLQTYGPLANARTVNEVTRFSRTRGGDCA